MVSVHDIHASVLASAGEEDYDVNLLELPGDAVGGALGSPALRTAF